MKHSSVYYKLMPVESPLLISNLQWILSRTIFSNIFCISFCSALWNLFHNIFCTIILLRLAILTPLVTDLLFDTRWNFISTKNLSVLIVLVPHYTVIGKNSKKNLYFRKDREKISIVSHSPSPYHLSRIIFRKPLLEFTKNLSTLITHTPHYTVIRKNFGKNSYFRKDKRKMSIVSRGPPPFHLSPFFRKRRHEFSKNLSILITHTPHYTVIRKNSKGNPYLKKIRVNIQLRLGYATLLSVTHHFFVTIY